MEASEEQGSRRFALTRTETRKLQQFLRDNGANLNVDGELGPETLKIAFDLYREGPVGLSDEMLWLLQSAAFSAGHAPLEWRIPPVWIFYSNPPSKDAIWVEALQRGTTIFWFHGKYPKGGAYKRRLREGDTVILVVGQDIVASGILLADEGLHFYDADNRVRRPVRVLTRYDPPLSRGALESDLGDPSPIGRGSVHPVPSKALSWINRQHEGLSLEALPYPQHVLDWALEQRSLSADVDTEGAKHGIRPDWATAEKIRWSGEPWQPGEGIGETTPRPSSGSEKVSEPEVDEEEATDVETAQGEDADVQIPYVLDAPADTEDDLDRGPLALFLAQRLHLIWCQINGHAPDRNDKRMRAHPPDSDTFIAHVDSPWGGGKSTFANFVARVLDPRREKLGPNHFLRSSLALTRPDAELSSIPLQDVFVPRYARQGEPGAERWSGARQPWIIGRYNAWRDQFVQPPWWQIFLSIYAALAREVRRDAAASFKAGHIRAGLKGLALWIGAHLSRFSYQVWNSKLQAQVGLWALVAILFIVLWRTGLVEYVFHSSTTGATAATVDAKKAADWIALAVAILGLGGASIATLFTILSQSISPDLDFTSEHRHIGVRDPIHRFRRTFERILRATSRPVLLIVDDLDRCEPSTVVEIMRGFQTIIRSPRLFVLLLGDRAWIEGAHDIHHKDLLALEGGEAKLGSLYVQKVIQLSFRLPVMKSESRRRFARRVLGESGETATATITPVLEKVESETRQIASGKGSIGSKEAAISRVIEEAKQELVNLSESDRRLAAAAVADIADTQVVAAAGADTSQQRDVFNAITTLIDCLPNNPRQIKRIFMAFVTYEQVGRRLYGYRLTPTGDDGELRARRWRQLALWVTLATEWPETWRAVARQPELLDVAYGPETGRAKRDKAFLEGVPESDRPAKSTLLRRLRTDPSLVALLSAGASASSAEAQAFASTSMESDAVYEFNRIIWEPGFLLQPELS